MIGNRRFAIFALALLCPIAAVPAAAETAFVAPPRTISDIREILDQQKPDPAAIARLQYAASVEVPTEGDPAQLARLYFQRAQARAGIGRTSEAATDAQLAIGHLRRAGGETFAMEHFLFAQIGYDPEMALPILAEMRRPYEGRDDARDAITVARLLTNYRYTLIQLVTLGDFAQAEAVLKKAQALFDLAASRRFPDADLYRGAWEGELEYARGFYLEGRGEYRAAEVAYAKSEVGDRDAMEKSAQWPHRPPRATFEFYIDSRVMALGHTKAWQGRVAEGETDVRRALLGRLRSVGKYHITTANFLVILSRILALQGRYAEAETLARSAAEILGSLGVAKGSRLNVRTLNVLAAILNFQYRWSDAAKVLRDLDNAMEAWPPERKASFGGNFHRIPIMYWTGEIEAGVALARRVAAQERMRVGEEHMDYARAQGTLGVGLVLLGRDAEALAAFRAVIPILTSSRKDEDESRLGPRFRDLTLRRIIPPYIAVVRRSGGTDEAHAAAETFALADALRARAVQNAIAASSARMVARDPALAELVRNEQDLSKQLAAHFVMLNDLLGRPPARRDERVMGDLQRTIARLRADHAKVQQDLERNFPEYSDLLEPKPTSVDEVRSLLRPDEALLSFYFGDRYSFVWAIPKAGPVAFVEIKATEADIASKVKALRAALEPNAATVADIPRFDLDLAYELYTQLLQPVEPAWKPAKSLIVVTNGALGMLPLSVLPTSSVTVDHAAKPDFAGYRKVPWLARTHAVTTVPSVAALRALRRLPPGSAGRETFIGFGDPFFNAEQAAEGERAPERDVVAATTRGLPLRRRSAPQTQGVDSAELGLLPRLPDTADELRSVALALQADPAKALFLGKAANEARVKSMDLSRYRIVAFATHGLVPGDLNGLTQPALALTAPKVAGVEGDGLLTMEEILALKLDADWVVLSACNTATGAEAGAEAASGLGRAFFYAGTRAILVTNWSVHSASARELVSDVFRRQAADPSVKRAEALRQAMMALLDKGGYADADGKMQFTYAHPLFWAPYSVIGDGAGTQ